MLASSAHVLGYNERAFLNGGLARRGHLGEQRLGVKEGKRRGESKKEKY